MNQPSRQPSRFVIACGGTGGHLFPGLAVAQKLAQRDCQVTLLVSPKEVDQHAVKCASQVDVVTLPAVCLKRGSEIAFIRGFSQSYRLSRKLFRWLKPEAALAMGGFTSAPPILAAKAARARTFLHESNTIPGRANRWLSRVVDHGFIGFPSAASRLKRCSLTISGTPVRPQFKEGDVASCRVELGLEPERPVVLVMGGSQGAHGINELVLRSLPLLAQTAPDWQWLHLTGSNDAIEVRRAYTALNLTAIVHPFFDRMECALGAASAAVTRAGASTLAELAVMELPALLVPYPSATDNHQWHNAHAYATTGAARLLTQADATPEQLARSLIDLVRNDAVRHAMQAALSRWHRPVAADDIADRMLEAVRVAELQGPLRLSSLRAAAPSAIFNPPTASENSAGELNLARKADPPEAFSV